MANAIAKNTSLKAINARIKSIAGTAAQLNNTIHNTAVACAEHALAYGDTDQCARLLDALPTSHRRSLLISWFEGFTAIGLGKNAKSGLMKAHLRGKAEERDAMWNIEAGKATPFYAMPEAENEPDVPTLASINSNVIAFIKRMNDKADKIVNPDERTLAKLEIATINQAVKEFADNPKNRAAVAF
jgi:hypothetical protein